jgi:hypothetical protein
MIAPSTTRPRRCDLFALERGLPLPKNPRHALLERIVAAEIVVNPSTSDVGPDLCFAT